MIGDLIPERPEVVDVRSENGARGADDARGVVDCEVRDGAFPTTIISRRQPVTPEHNDDNR